MKYSQKSGMQDQMVKKEINIIFFNVSALILRG